MAESIDVKMDVSDVVASAKAFVASLRAQGTAAEDMGVAFVQLNQKLNVAKIGINTLSEEGNKIVTTLKNTKDGFSVLKVTIDSAVSSFKALKEAQDAAQKSAYTGPNLKNMVAADFAGTELRQAFDIKSLDLTKINTAESAILKIKAAIESGKVSAQEFDQIFTKLTTNPKSVFPNATADEAKVASALRNIIKLFQDQEAAAKKSIQSQIADQDRNIKAFEKFEAAALKALNTQKKADAESIASADKRAAALKAIADKENAQADRQAAAYNAKSAGASAGNAAEMMIRNKVDFSNLNATKINQYEAAIQRVKAALESGSVSLTRFQDLLRTLTANPKALFPNVTQDEARVIAALRGITSGFQATNIAGKTAGETILISWQGIVRLFEAQVIRRAIQGILTQFQQSISAAQALNIELTRVSSISSQGASGTEQWSAAVSKLSNEFGQPQIQVAQAAYIGLQSQIVKSTSDTSLLTTALRLSAVTGATASDSMKGLATVLNAYKLPASDAERIASVFSQTISRGMMTADEATTSFGRLATAGAPLGVSFNELAAAMQVLTQKGVKTSDASALIISLLQKAVNPSKELKDQFTALGAASGQAFIQMQGGLGGFLQYLDTQGQQGTGRLGELATQFRFVRAAANLTGDALSGYNQALAATTSGQQAFGTAAQAMKDSFGQKFTVELEKIKVFFTDEIGTNFIKGIITLGEMLGGDQGLVGALKKVIAVAKIAVLSFIAFKVAQVAMYIPAIFSMLLADIKSVIIAIRAATAAQVAFGVATAGIALIAASAYIIADARTGSDTYDSASNQAKEEARKRQEDEDKQARTNAAAGNKTAEQTQVDDVKKAYDERYSVILAYSGRVLALADTMRKRAVDSLKAISDEIKISGKTFTDSIQKQITELNHNISEAKNIIKASNKSLEDQANNTGGAIFSERMRYASNNAGADPLGANGIDQKAILIKQRITEITAMAEAEYAKGTKDGIAEGRKLYAELQKLQLQLFTDQADRQKSIGMLHIAAGQDPNGSVPGPGNFRAIGTDANGKTRYEFVVQTAQMERTINQLAADRLALEKQVQAVQLERQKKAEADAEKEKERLRTVQQLIQQMAQFTVLDKDGAIKKEYKDDPARASRDFQDITNRLSNAAGPAAIQGQFQFFSDMYKQRLAIVQQVETQIAAEQAKTNQTAVLAQQAALTARTNGLTTSGQAAIQTIREQSVSLEGIIAGLKTRLNVASVYAPPDTLMGAGQRVNPLTSGPAAQEDAAIAAALPKLNTAKAAWDALAEAQRNYSATGGQTADNLQQVTLKFLALKAAVQEYIAVRTGIPRENALDVAPPNSRNGDALNPQRTVGGEFTQGQGALNALQQAQAAKDAATSALQQAKQDAVGLNTALQTARDGLTALGPAAVGAGATAQARFQAMTADVNLLTKALQDNAAAVLALNTALGQRAGNGLAAPNNNAPGWVNPGPGPAPVPGQMYGGLPKPAYFASGGPVSWQARGSDNIPAMLSAGEMVMPEQVVNSFRPQLESMMNMVQPRYMAGGGQVTNVGDINVTVNGGSVAEKTIKEIATGLRREIRRGTISSLGKAD